jgi:hypothetical protein
MAGHLQRVNEPSACIKVGKLWTKRPSTSQEGFCSREFPFDNKKYSAEHST